MKNHREVSTFLFWLYFLVLSNGAMQNPVSAVVLAWSQKDRFFYLLFFPNFFSPQNVGSGFFW